MSEFSWEELFELYKRVYQNARSQGMDDAQAGKKAWQEVCEYAPEIKAGENYEKNTKRTKLLSNIGGFRYSVQVKGRGAVREPKREMKRNIQSDDSDGLDRFDNDDIFWTERMEAAALHVGRIVDPKFVTTFIGPHKARQFSAYIAALRGAGYKFVRDEYGWLVTDYPPEPEPEPVKKPEPIGPTFTLNRELIKVLLNEAVRMVNEGYQPPL